MTSTWPSTLPIFALAVLLVLGPGLLIGTLLGLRGLVTFAAAPPISIGILGAAAMVAQAMDVEWSILPATAATLLVAASLVLLRSLHGGGGATSWGRDRTVGLETERTAWPLAAWCVAVLVVMPHVLRIIGQPGNIAQSHDNVFHLNAIRYIVDSGSGSSLTLASLGTHDGLALYPAAWHDMVALLVATTSTSIPAAINVANIVLLGTAWPLGCLYLTRQILGQSPRSLLIGAVLCGAFSSFPYFLLDFGVVYPFMLSLTLMPTLLAASLEFLRPAGKECGDRRRGGVAFFASLPGLLLAHPSGFAILIALLLPIVIAGIARWRRAYPDRRRSALAVAVALGYLIGLIMVWTFVRPPRVTNWDAWGRANHALAEAALIAPVNESTPWFLVGLSIAGLAYLIYKRDERWVLGLYLIGVSFYVLSQLRGLPELRWWITGVWYSDPFRIAGLLPLVVLPLCALGANWLLELVSGQLSRVTWGAAIKSTVVIGMACTLLGVLGVQTSAVRSTVSTARDHNRFSKTSYLLTTDEMALLERLPKEVPADALVAGNPMTGASLGYAFAQRQAVEPYLGVLRGADGETVMRRLDRMRQDPDVCPAVERLNVQFVLDFGESSVDPGQISRTTGLDRLDGESGFELVDQEGAAKLFKIVGCPRNPERARPANSAQAAS